jgi:CDP-paratose 2-epimerase
MASAASDMKILITGICGFVGSTLAAALQEAIPGAELYGLDNFIRPGSEYNRITMQKRGIKLFHGDIRCASDFEELPAVDWVIDAAANPSVLAGIDGQTSSRQLIEHNLLGTINILEYCKRHTAGFILISTSRVYSFGPLAEVEVEVVGEAVCVKEEQNLPPGLSGIGVAESFSTTPPVSLYGGSKLASEVLALEYGNTFGFPVWINRCGVLAGAGQFGRPDQGIFAFWINAWLRRRPLSYIGFGGNGYQVRDCLHPRDLVSLLRKQMAVADGRQRFINIGGGAAHATSLAELSAWCRDRYGDYHVSGNPDIRRFDIPWLVMDSTLAGKIWGWHPEMSLAAILEEIALHAEAHPHWLEISGVA